MKQLGLIIKQLRKDKRISQTELGKLVGVSTQSVSEWETGKARPDISRLQLIAKELGTSVDILTQTTSQRQSQSSGSRKNLIVDISQIKQLPLISLKAQSLIVSGNVNDCQAQAVNEYYQLKLPSIDLDEEKHVVIEIEGDSMEPDIKSRSLVLGKQIASDAIKEESNAVYAIQYARHFVVRRIKSNDIAEKGRLTIHSDNSRYGPMSIDANDIKCMWKILRIVDSPVY